MKLSRTVEYAVQATLQLAQSQTGGPVPCSQLAASNAMPERFLLQILRSLVTHGILSSTRGVVGGYVLQRRPEEISLLDLIEAIEGPLVGSLPLTILAEPTLGNLQKAMQDVAAAKLPLLAGLRSPISCRHHSPRCHRRRVRRTQKGMTDRYQVLVGTSCSTDVRRAIGHADAVYASMAAKRRFARHGLDGGRPGLLTTLAAEFRIHPNRIHPAAPQ